MSKANPKNALDFDREIELIMSDWPKGKPWPYESPPNRLVEGQVGRYLRHHPLQNNQRWIEKALKMTSKELEFAIENSGGTVLSVPGRGLVHVAYCDSREVEAFTSELREQASKLLTRAKEIELATRQEGCGS